MLPTTNQTRAMLFLVRNRHILMRAQNGNPPSWGPMAEALLQQDIGGRIFPSLQQAMREQAGLTEDDVSRLKLRYMVCQLRGPVMQQDFYYFAQVDSETVLRGLASRQEEWVPWSELENRAMDPVQQAVLVHFRTNYLRRPLSEKVYVGMVSDQDVRFHLLQE